MTMRKVCLDYHIVVDVDVPDDMEDEQIADAAYNAIQNMSYEDIVGELIYDGYLIDY